MNRPAAPVFTDQMAASWRSRVDPRLGRIAVVAAWVAAITISIIAGADDRCLPEDPSLCGPDVLWAWAAVPLLATPLLIWWMPLVACAAGVVFALFDQLGDPDQELHVVWGLYGVLCVAVGLSVVASRNRQRRTTQVATRGASRRVAALDPGRTPFWATTAVIVCIIAAIGSLIRYHHDVVVTAAHVAAAETFTATVTSIDADDYELHLDLGDRGNVTVEVLDTGQYSRGDELPVLVDGSGSEPWAELVAEPADPTGWLSLAVGGFGMALLLILREARRRRSVRELSLRGGPAVEMDASWTPSGVELAPVDGMRPVVSLRLRRDGRAGPDGAHDHEIVDVDVDDDWDPREAIAEFGAAWRGTGGAAEEAEAPVFSTRVTVLGVLAEGSYVVVITDDGSEVPTGTVREVLTPIRSQLGRVLPGRRASAAPRVGPDGLPGVSVAASADTDVPRHAGPPMPVRLAGFAMIAAAALPPVGIFYDFFDSWWQAAWISWGGGALCLGGLAKLVSVRLEHSRLVIDAPIRTLVVPWARVHGVRRDAEILLVACDPDVVIPVGPFAGAGSRAEAAEQVGGAMMRLRERALAAGNSGVEPTWAYNSRLGVLAVYGVICVVAFTWHYLPR